MTEKSTRPRASLPKSGLRSEKHRRRADANDGSSAHGLAPAGALAPAGTAFSTAPCLSLS